MPAPVEGLLHLAALSAALSVGYVGLDRVHQADQTISNEIAAAKRLYGEIIQDFDPVRKSDGKVKLECKVMAIYVLCYISGGKLPTEWWRAIVLPFFTFWHFPFVGYFRRRFDLTFVSILAIVSTSIFLLMSFSLVYHTPLLESLTVIKIFFWYFVFNVGWIFFTVFFSGRIMRIRDTGEYLRKRIRLRLEEFGDGQIDVGVNAANNLSTSATPER